MSQYDTIIIGAGLGGLISSALLARTGKKVLLLEQHRIPGGACTSYSRKGFTFNIPSILGGLASDELGQALADLGFFDEIQWTTIQKFGRYVYPDLDISLPAGDPAACEEVVHQAFPREKKAVGAFFADIVKVKKAMGLLQKQGRSLREALSMLCSIPLFMRLSRISFHDYMRRYTRDERLITVLSSMWGYSGLPAGKVPALYLLCLSVDCYCSEITFPEKGFQAIPDLLADKISQAGGEIRYRTGVTRILLQGGRARGVETSDGERIEADAVISNADTRKTFLELVGRRNLSPKQAATAHSHTSSSSGLSLHIGTDLDLTGLDLAYGGVFVQESWETSDTIYHRLSSEDVCLETDAISFGLQAPSLLSPALAPEGKHLLHVLVQPISPRCLSTSSTREGRRGMEYRKIKQQLADALVSKVERLVPGLSDAVVLSELATPLTFERYAGATGGAWYDRASAVGASARQPSARTSIQGLFLSGTKAFAGGGMQPAMQGGLMAARAVLGGRRIRTD